MAHPVTWFEVRGNDSPKLQQFYGALFGWTFELTIKYGMTNMRGELAQYGPEAVKLLDRRSRSG